MPNPMLASAIWSFLKDHAQERPPADLRRMFADDPGRAARMTHRVGALTVDLSKHLVNEKTVELLLDLARNRQVLERLQATQAGEIVNTTEHRAALHSALRLPPDATVTVDEVNVVPMVHEELDKAFALAERIRSGDWTGATGERITDVVNIGIGGSDLGPVMAVAAVAPVHDGPRCHFVSNVDGAHVHDVLAGLDPQTTLVLIASKTFTTIETMTNAHTARAWMEQAIGDRAGAHFAALSTALDEVGRFGIDESRTFGFWDWVGGRYSLWSAIGLSLMIAIGREDFEAFLAGGRAMDAHFRQAPLEENLPVLLALAGVWHRDALGLPSRAVIPYDQRLLRLPAYLQQLDMESNGKTARLRDGLAGETGPVVWGEPGTNGQHAFFQLLHQGTTVIPVEFLAAAQGWEPELAHHHVLLLANCLAQSEALMAGRSEAEAYEMMIAEGKPEAEARRLAPHRAFAGDRPSTTLLYRRLDPFTLGRIVALYEHRVFVEGAIWGVNSFDQWGVELGKTLAKALEPMVTGAASAESKDGSTAGLIAAIHALREG